MKIKAWQRAVRLRTTCDSMHFLIITIHCFIWILAISVLGSTDFLNKVYINGIDCNAVYWFTQF